MKVEVKCSVSNCEYWARGNECVASSILVTVDRHSSADLNVEFGMMNGQQADNAAHSAETCCHTFVPKRANP
ncbi:MAG: DUF1540 domain-containing protein [Alicyclobacillus sp.]|nr:DUF1540 domain-containing protein [Alicyclobacillus sp.]